MSARIVGALMAASLAAASSPAQDADKKKAAEMAMPKPAAEMSNLAFFGGEWTCSGKGAMEPGGAMVPMSSTVSSRTDMGGFWQAGTVKGTTPGMPPFEGMFHMTYDPGAKDYLMLWVDNMGGWSQQRSPGWQGDKIVFSGTSTMGGQTFTTRDTFAKKADGTMSHMGEMEAAGKYVTMMEESCRKGGSR